MSTRSIIEIDHRKLYCLERLPAHELFALIRRATTITGDSHKGEAVANDSGIRALAHRHSSEPITVTVDGDDHFSEA